MQPKIDGIRGGQPFNRLGEPLSDSKGAATLRAMFKGVDVTLDGEWVPGEGTTPSICRMNRGTMTTDFECLWG